jgi:uncharacterized protein (TIGR02246 family)
MRGNDVNHIILNQKNDDTLVQNLVEKFRDAFNRHDPQTIGSLLMEDGEWTDVMGQTMIGRKEIEDGHTYPFTTVLKEATLDVKSFRSSWINDEIVSIDIKWESSGHKTPDGKHIPIIRYGLLNLTATKTKEKEGGDTILRIIIAHNNDYTSTYTQSDRKQIIEQKRVGNKE